MVHVGMNRRRGQGMTEYIILVGLIAMLLIFAVTRYKNQVQITIEGTGTAVELATMAPGESLSGNGPGGRSMTFTKTGNTHTDGSPVFRGSDGANYINSGGSWTSVP